MLQTTHQPEPSLRHRLASRLESCLQSMHTPPAATDDGPLPGFDPSWAIFDQNSIAMASLLPERQPLGGTAQNGGSGHDAAMSGIYDAQSLINQEAMDGQWFSHEQQADAWQSTLMRLFGNAEFSQSQNPLV
jgi:hypothetical protein